MLKYIQGKIRKWQNKRRFNEYGYEIRQFDIPEFGQVEYAQWLHPLEGTKQIQLSNIQFYQKLVPAGGLILDIGAHTGDTTVPMALATGKNGTVLAFEPNPYVFKILQQNAQRNTQQTNIIPYCLAATQEDGTFTFHYSDASFCNGGFLSQINKKNHGHAYSLEITGKNLQRFLEKNHGDLLPNLKLIKIDAEGYDKEILKTLLEIIHQYHPHLMIECYKNLNEAERFELFDIVSELGYTLFLLNNFEVFEHLIQIERKDMLVRKHFEILAVHTSQKHLFQKLNSQSHSKSV
ncbi:MAG: FkbM family methyltransferase [Bacteroidetes bacterium]|nr:FkbM family methyltransferase [Bacteroidota bacterium]